MKELLKVESSERLNIN